MTTLPLPPSDQLAKLREYVRDRKRVAQRFIDRTDDVPICLRYEERMSELCLIENEIDRLAKEGQS